MRQRTQPEFGAGVARQPGPKPLHQQSKEGLRSQRGNRDSSEQEQEGRCAAAAMGAAIKQARNS